MQEKPDFYIINPIFMELTKEEGICVFSDTVNVYHHQLLPSLQDRINKTKQVIK
jgi:hypothetical protein